MLKKIFSLLALIVVFVASSYAQTITPEQYIQLYKDFAMREMKRMGVPAAITLAQGLLETENGNSDLLKKSNNHFGIKCKSTWTSGSVTHDDDETGECFRLYKDAEESYRDHSNFLRGSDRYAFLFALDPTDYKGWAYGLRKAGYATNPKYPLILIKNIEQYNLQQYSLLAAREVPTFEESKSPDEKETVTTVTKAAPAVNFFEKENSNEQIATQASFKVDYINGHKCLFAKKGISLLAIATQNDINLNKLLEYNDLDNDGILEDDRVIFLQRKSTRGINDFYIVQQEKTLYDVAQANGIQLQSLLDYNNLKKDGDVQRGAKLYLKTVAETDQAKTIQRTASIQKLYRVQPKEGLYTVAKKYNVSVQQLRDWNKLTSDELTVGQQLIVSQ